MYVSVVLDTPLGQGSGRKYRLLVDLNLTVLYGDFEVGVIYLTRENVLL